MKLDEWVVSDEACPVNFSDIVDTATIIGLTFACDTLLLFTRVLVFASGGADGVDCRWAADVTLWWVVPIMVD